MLAGIMNFILSAWSGTIAFLKSFVFDQTNLFYFLLGGMLLTFIIHTFVVLGRGGSRD